MATIKAYTDISQSKKLAEILSPESADMGYLWNGYRFSEYPVSNQTIFKRVENIPCWSLAALLNVLPKTINFGYENDSTFSLNSLENGKYLADYYEISYVKDNPVDACVDMIIKLKEKGLL